MRVPARKGRGMKDCTCRIVIMDDTSHDPEDSIEFCPRHAAVDDLIAALTDVLAEDTEPDVGGYQIVTIPNDVHERARAALARATGEAVRESL